MKPTNLHPPGPVMSAGGDMPQNRLLTLAMGHYVSRCLHIAADLGIADALREGPKTAEQIAAKIGIQSPRNLHRVMRVLSDYGVFFHGRESNDSPTGVKFSLTAASEFLLSDHPLSLRDSVRLFGSELLLRPFDELKFSVDTGGTAFTHVFHEDLFSHLARDKDSQQLFDRGMTGLAKNIHFAILLAYDFSRFKKIVDIGGGQGALLAAILETNKEAEGILFDQPHVLATAEEIKRKEELLKGRIQLIGGDFFIGVPEGGDAYVMTTTLHDWDDDTCLKILNNVYKAMPTDGVLLIGEAVLPTDGSPHFGTLMDLTMLVTTDGKERTEEEWRQLLGKASFQITKIVNTQSAVSLIEATKMQQIS